MSKTTHSQRTFGNLSLLEQRVYGGCKECVRVVIHPIPSDVDSLLIVRISYDQRNKNVGNSVFDLFRIEGRPNRLAPHNVYLRELERTVSPHLCCHHHQNSKAEDALTTSYDISSQKDQCANELIANETTTKF